MNFEQKFKKVFSEARKQNVAARMQVNECCRSCINHDKLKMTDKNQSYFFTYAGQDNRLVFTGDSVINKKSRNSVSHIWIYHGNDGARMFCDLAHQYGLDVEWSGDELDAVKVNVNVT